MLEIEKPNILCESKSDDNTYAKFVMEPLECCSPVCRAQR
jgi:DNA-directed RNA polymerase subunit alpha